MKYIIAQIIGIIAFIISLIAYHRYKKEKILGTTLISNILNMIHYLLLEASSGFITKVLALIRDTIVIFKNKFKVLRSNLIFYLFLIIYIVIMIVTFDSLINTFPMLAALIYLVFIWNGNELLIKKTVIITDILWLIYNIYVLSIPGIISKLISLISNIVAVIIEIKRCKKSHR